MEESTIDDNRPSEIISNHWGEDGLLRIDRSAMRNLLLPNAAVDYLSNVGIIRESEFISQSLGVSFDCVTNDTITTLQSHFSHDLNGNDISDSLNSWVLLGHCYDKLISVSTDNGSVSFLEGDPESGFIDWFVNSSIECFILFITLAVQSFEKGPGESTVAEAVQVLSQRFVDRDPEAMSEATNWWPIMLNEIEPM